MNGSSYIMTL